MEPEADTIIAGRYRLETEIGRGGMGTVWRAHDDRLARPVAVKLLSRPAEKTDDEGPARFEREAKAVAALRSPHIVQIHDYGVEGSTRFMVIELLEGHTLASRLQQLRRLNLEVVARIIGQVARALTAAHDVGIVHRDLKPANIFLVQDRDEEIVKVLDFGLAKVFTGPRRSDTLTTAGVMVGTPTYMSPEQILCDPVDARADLWSLGVVAYIALTGEAPFSGEVAHLLTKICDQPTPRPRELLPALPTELDRFFEVALSKHPARRFASARKMSDELLRIAGLDTIYGMHTDETWLTTTRMRDQKEQPPTAATKIDGKASPAVAAKPGPATATKIDGKGLDARSVDDETNAGFEANDAALDDTALDDTAADDAQRPASAEAHEGAAATDVDDAPASRSLPDAATAPAETSDVDGPTLPVVDEDNVPTLPVDATRARPAGGPQAALQSSPDSRKRGATTHDAQRPGRPSWWRGTDAWWLIPASVLALLVALGLLWASATGERPAATGEGGPEAGGDRPTTGLTADEGTIEAAEGQSAPPAQAEGGESSTVSAPDSSSHGGSGHAPSTSEADEP